MQDKPTRRRPLRDRFEEKVAFAGPDDCWQWQAMLDRQGYGRIASGGDGPGVRPLLAHRVAYVLYVGPIPDGLCLDHLCRNRACVNPAHLEAVTNAENIRRGEGGAHWAAKTHCPHGHEYAGANLVINSKGRRECRTCRNARERERLRRIRHASSQEA